MVVKFKSYFILIFIFSNLGCLLFPNLLDDFNQDNIIDLTKKDLTSDNEKDPTSDENTALGNKWFSRNNIFLNQTADAGLSGSKDFFEESFLFSYRFRSKTRHAFSLRLFHLGYSPGIFSSNFTFYNFGIMAGFEYFYKLFDNLTGVFLWSDFGACNGGFTFSTGFGLGSRVKNGLELWGAYLHNTGIFSRLEFYFLVLKILTLRGKIGIDYKHTNFNLEVFTFLGGFYIGFFIKNIFRIEAGGGFTINEFSYFSGFGGISISFNLL